MLKKTITYTDYNGTERTEDFYFNISEAELHELELTTEGGYAELLQAAINAKDVPTLISSFKAIIFKAYGEKSPDGRQFVKSEELSKAFSQTPAYTKLYMSLITDANEAANFCKGILPAKVNGVELRPEKAAN